MSILPSTGLQTQILLEFYSHYTVKNYFPISLNMYGIKNVPNTRCNHNEIYLSYVMYNFFFFFWRATSEKTFLIWAICKVEVVFPWKTKIKFSWQLLAQTEFHHNPSRSFRHETSWWVNRTSLICTHFFFQMCTQKEPTKHMNLKLII